MKSIYIIITLLCFSVFLSCESDIPNPNQATDEEAFNDQRGLIAISVGLRQYYSTTALTRIIITPGVSTRELAAFTTFVNYQQLQDGGEEILPNNSFTTGLWSQLYTVVGISERIINSVPGVVPDPAVADGLIAHANFYRALALLNLVQSFEQITLETNEAGVAEFTDRATALQFIAEMLEGNINTFTNNPPPASFLNDIGGNVDINFSSRAVLARVYLMQERYQDAIDMSMTAPMNQVSEFTYDSENANPLWQLGVNSNDWRPIDNCGLSQVAPEDGRLAFFLSPADTTGYNNVQVENLVGFYAQQTASIPVYRPSEMMLIRAEAYARLNQAENAIVEINNIRTKTDDPLGINAGLPEYSGGSSQQELLEEIYVQRAIELFLNGQRLEDSKRLGIQGPPNSTEFRTRNFYPYPDNERFNNPNTPADPNI